MLRILENALPCTGVVPVGSRICIKYRDVIVMIEMKEEGYSGICISLRAPLEYRIDNTQHVQCECDVGLESQSVDEF